MTSAAAAPRNRILIVEDEGIVALDIRTHLEDLGYEVVGIAASAQQALELANNSSPDLVLMDIHLHGSRNGIAAATEIRRQRRVPIVFLTAFIDPQTVEAAKTVEPYGYLVKPFDRRSLGTTIGMAIHKASADRALQEAHDDLTSIIGAQQHGTVLLDVTGRTVFISSAARRMLRLSRVAEAMSLRQLFAGDDGSVSAIECAINRSGKRKVTLEVPGKHVECDVLDDPRADDRTILVLTERKQQQSTPSTARQLSRLVGESPAMQEVVALISQFAAVEAPVLIEGETGTGKDLVARAIHDESRRRTKPLLALNCAGLSEDLAASQLFGHRRGAFTGANEEHAGLFEAAHGGTLFLDEIGELPLRVQTTLLRVLEEHAVMRVGETSLRPVNVRIIAATNRKLNEEIEQGRFRADLLYRIRVARIQVPALRDRIEDLPVLTDLFVQQHSAAIGKQLTGVAASALDLLMTYDWPGNVRELRNTLEYAAIRASGDQIETSDLPPEITDLPLSKKSALAPALERDQIIQALRKTGGNRKLAAARLGMSRATFYRRIAQLNIGEDG